MNITDRVDWHAVNAQRLAVAWSVEEPDLPPSWWGRLRRHVDDLVRPEPAWHRATAAYEILQSWRQRYGGVIHAHMTHADICAKADALAAEARGLRFGVLCAGAIGTRTPAGAQRARAEAVGAGVDLVDPWPEWRRLSAWITRHHGTPPDLRNDDIGDQVQRLARRAQCPRWWRRQLRRHVARIAETAAIELGLVCTRTRQIYCSDAAVQRRQAQQLSNERALKSREIENGNGQRFNLWECMARGVSNKAIRRGELMTRIRGAEELADEGGLEGFFWTLTAPSRFHSRDHRTGVANPRYQPGLSPRDGQLWLRETWARARTRLKDRGIKVMGLRVAEPHHDGCPHWHALLWCRPEHAEKVREVIGTVWLEDGAEEPGARKHRTKWMRMSSGAASAYVAKYIAKNIDTSLSDPAGHDYQLDHDELPPMSGPRDLLDDPAVTPATRVEAWAATWGLRQFQAIGMPSVTVWRELRRIHERAIAGHGDPKVTDAWWAAHRHRDERATWAGYCRAQGGVMLKRSEYRIRLHTVEFVREAGYDVGTVARRPVGVTSDAMRGSHAPSMRQPWGSAGFSAHKRAAWTCLHNCGPDGKRIHRFVNGPMWKWGKQAWEPPPAPNARDFGDRTPHDQIVRELIARNQASREAVALPVVPDPPRPPPLAAEPPPFSDVVAALLARTRPAAASPTLGGYRPDESVK